MKLVQLLVFLWKHLTGSTKMLPVLVILQIYYKQLLQLRLLLKRDPAMTVAAVIVCNKSEV